MAKCRPIFSSSSGPHCLPRWSVSEEPIRILLPECGRDYHRESFSQWLKCHTNLCLGATFGPQYTAIQCHNWASSAYTRRYLAQNGLLPLHKARHPQYLWKRQAHLSLRQLSFCPCDADFKIFYQPMNTQSWNNLSVRVFSKRPSQQAIKTEKDSRQVSLKKETLSSGRGMRRPWPYVYG